MIAFQDGELLLTERQILEQEAPTGAPEANQRSEAQANKSKHG
jgi:hypothetical protein